MDTRIKDEPAYRHPCTTEEEHEAVLAEMAADGIPTESYLAACAAPSRLAMLSASPALSAALARLLGEEAGGAPLRDRLAALSCGVPAAGQRLLPSLPMPLAELLAERLPSGARALLFNAGFGALWWSEAAAATVVIEREERWAQLLASLVAPERMSVLQKRADAFPRVVAELNQAPDIAVFDGPERGSSRLSLLPKLPASGIVRCRQMERREASLFSDALRRAAFRELRLRGPVAGAAAHETAAAFYRDGNILGL